MYLDAIRARFEKSDLVDLEGLVPCTVEEVRLLEQQLHLSLPRSYQEFLLWAGHGAGFLLRGTDCFYEHLLDIQQWTVDLLKENNYPRPLPNDVFVLSMHQGYTFKFIRTTEGDDPPVYYYLEGMDSDTFVTQFKAFSDFLASEVEFTLKILGGLPGHMGSQK